jgi:UDP-2-acetamido-2-deoxy-ribo-hexuluronate aminotransferase
VLAERYRTALSGVSGLRLLAVRADRDCTWAQFTVFVERRSQVQAALTAVGVPTAVHYPKPLHHQPAYRAYAQAGSCPKSAAAGDAVLSLPMSADLSESDQSRVIEAVVAALRHARAR